MTVVNSLQYVVPAPFFNPAQVRLCAPALHATASPTCCCATCCMARTGASWRTQHGRPPMPLPLPHEHTARRKVVLRLTLQDMVALVECWDGR